MRGIIETTLDAVRLTSAANARTRRYTRTAGACDAGLRPLSDRESVRERRIMNFRLNLMNVPNVPGQGDAKQTLSRVRDMIGRAADSLDAERQDAIDGEVVLDHREIGTNRQEILSVVEEVARNLAPAHVPSCGARDLPFGQAIEI